MKTSANAQTQRLVTSLALREKEHHALGVEYSLVKQQLASAQGSLERNKLNAAEEHTAVRRHWHEDKQRAHELQNTLADVIMTRKTLEAQVADLERTVSDRDQAVARLTKALADVAEQKGQAVSEREGYINRLKLSTQAKQEMETKLSQQRQEQADQFHDVQTRLELEKERFEESEQNVVKLKEKITELETTCHQSESKYQGLMDENEAVKQAKIQFETDKKEILELHLQLQTSLGNYIYIYFIHSPSIRLIISLSVSAVSCVIIIM